MIDIQFAEYRAHLCPCISAYPRLQHLIYQFAYELDSEDGLKGSFLSILLTTLLLSIIGPLADLLWQCSSSFFPVRVTIYSGVDSIHPFSTEYSVSVSSSLLFCFECCILLLQVDVFRLQSRPYQESNWLTEPMLR